MGQPAYEELKRLVDLYPTLAAGEEKDRLKQTMLDLAERRECRQGHLNRYAHLVIAEPFI